jgi:hypothetical protein
MVVLGVTLQLCGYIIERNAIFKSTDTETRWRYVFLLGMLIELAITIPLVTLTDQIENRKTGFVEAMIFYAFYYTLFAVNCFYDAWFMSPIDIKVPLTESQREKNSKATDGDVAFMITDERYAVLVSCVVVIILPQVLTSCLRTQSFTSKQALLWITIGMIKYQQTENELWVTIIFVAEWVPLCGLVIFLLHQSYRMNGKKPFNSLFENSYSPTRVEIGKTFTSGFSRFRDFLAAFFNVPAAKPPKRGETMSTQTAVNISTGVTQSKLNKRVFFSNKGLSF